MKKSKRKIIYQLFGLNEKAIEYLEKHTKLNKKSYKIFRKRLIGSQKQIKAIGSLGTRADFVIVDEFHDYKI